MKLISEEIQTQNTWLKKPTVKNRTRLKVSFYNQISKIEMDEYMKMISYKRSK